MDDLVPPPELVEELHIGGGDFAAVGEEFVSRFARNGWIAPHHTIVDIGCGLGRMARPLIKFLGPEGRYAGFDINPRAIEWCRERYAKFPAFRFDHVDVSSRFYNPSGQLVGSHVRFPMPDASADFINMSSVFTHILPPDVGGHLSEVARLLKPTGRCSLTFFLLDERVRFALNDEAVRARPPRPGDLMSGQWWPVEGGLIRSKEKPEAVVLLDESLVRDCYQNAGLEIASVEYGNWCGSARGSQAGAGRFQDCIDALRVGAMRA